jgi:phage FluMu protein Com
MLRKDAARHATETCGYRQSGCKFCGGLLLARDLPEHEDVKCPEVNFPKPNTTNPQPSTLSPTRYTLNPIRKPDALNPDPKP